jgi:hypothetical protein
MVYRRDMLSAQDRLEYESEPAIPLTSMVRTMIRYRYVLLLSLLSAAALYAILAAAIFLFGPSQKIASIPFRLEFSGAETGTYPNGMRFTTSDIVATPILHKVYSANQLSNFVEFQDFSSAVFILESNQILEQLADEYRARLSERNLSAIDRERIQEEYRIKRESLARSAYSINFMIGRETSKIPRSVINKLLAQTLAAWAEYAVNTKGAVRYKTPVLTDNILTPDILNEQPIIALDILRTKINEVVRNIDQLLQIPGAEVLRTDDRNISLVEIRGQLDDLIRLRLRPLISKVHAAGLVQDHEGTVRYLRAQLVDNEYRVEEGNARVSRLREALDTYQGGSRPAADAMSSTPRAQPPSGEIVMPQLSESFLEQIVSLSGQNADRRYRQEFVDEIKSASLQNLSKEAEIIYYGDVLSLLTTSGASRSGTEEELAAVQDELARTLSELTASIHQVNRIYDLISVNLNSSTALFTTLAPPRTRVERATSPARLALLGALLLMVALAVAVAGSLLHARMGAQDEPAEERPLVRKDRAPTDVTTEAAG